jgi:hypothetical protein
LGGLSHPEPSSDAAAAQGNYWQTGRDQRDARRWTRKELLRKIKLTTSAQMWLWHAFGESSSVREKKSFGQS